MDIVKITDDVLEKLRTGCLEIPWSVFAWSSEGVGEIFTCADADCTGGTSCPRAFESREAAIAFADDIRAGVIVAHHLHGLGVIGELIPYILAYGIPWDQR